MIAIRRFGDFPAPDPHEVQQLVEQIKPFVAGRNPLVISAALADLLALLLAGCVSADAGEQQEMCDEILAGFVELVSNLIPENEKEILRHMPPASRA